MDNNERVERIVAMLIGKVPDSTLARVTKALVFCRGLTTEQLDTMMIERRQVIHHVDVQALRTGGPEYAERLLRHTCEILKEDLGRDAFDRGAVTITQSKNLAQYTVEIMAETMLLVPKQIPTKTPPA